MITLSIFQLVLIIFMSYGLISILKHIIINKLCPNAIRETYNYIPYVSKKYKWVVCNYTVKSKSTNYYYKASKLLEYEDGQVYIEIYNYFVKGYEWHKIEDFIIKPIE